MSPIVPLVLAIVGGFALGYLMGRMSHRAGERVQPIPSLPTATGGAWAESLDWWEPWGEDPNLPVWMAAPEHDTGEPIADTDPDLLESSPDRRARIADALRHL